MLKNPILCSIIAAAALIATGCSNQPSHPNQINALDGATYDSLTAAHAALGSLRPQIAVAYPKYAPAFNEATAAYAAAFNSYAAFRINPSDQTAMSVAINNLTVSIVGLENTFAADMHVNPQASIKIRQETEGVRARLQSKIAISDILTELEIAAAIAQTVPQAQAYSALANIVIQATSAAVAAEETASGQAINLSTVQPLPAI